jgi:integrase/recombinase XerC
VTELLPIQPASSAGQLAAAQLSIDLCEAVLSGRKATTLRAYKGDLRDFAAFLGYQIASKALDAFVSFSGPYANAAALAYRAHLLDRKLSPATISRRLAALRTAVKVARMLGRVAWDLEVESPRSETYRDTSGPGRDGWKAVLAIAKERAVTPRGVRDLAVLRLLHDLALRRGEVVGLDLVDLDLRRSIVQVKGKGKSSKAPISLPKPTAEALRAWVVLRGDSPGSLFGISGEWIRQLVRGLGRAAQLDRPLRPHGLRHQGITQALDATGGDVRAVRRFSRHAKLETLVVYDDNRADLAGDVARLVSDDD